MQQKQHVLTFNNVYLVHDCIDKNVQHASYVPHIDWKMQGE